uniref:Uncharacterized protein n=1 Tax=Candidatus Kentrum sp. LFY TaxID=2126342 RepID=A0A450UR21_9GAMM|nr:MAG: hypothetical protein BECKLFY1418A_GA0070994_10462 [Candidatus Kentron sp. LFY]
MQNAQHAIEAAEPHHRERALRERFSDPDASHALLKPLTAYNDFAKRFGCQVYPPERLYWKQDLALDNGVALRIHGLTSTLLSGAGGDDDTRGSLYLSLLQTVLDPVDSMGRRITSTDFGYRDRYRFCCVWGFIPRTGRNTKEPPQKNSWVDFGTGKLPRA